MRHSRAKLLLSLLVQVAQHQLLVRLQLQPLLRRPPQCLVLIRVLAIARAEFPETIAQTRNRQGLRLVAVRLFIIQRAEAAVFRMRVLDQRRHRRLVMEVWIGFRSLPARGIV